MIRTDVEVIAMKAAKRALGEAVGHCGFDRPPRDWSSGEALGITTRVIDAYRKEFWRISKTEVPF